MARAPALTPTHARTPALCLSLSLSLSLSPACWGTLLFASLVDMPVHLKDGVSCYHPNKTELEHWAVTPICLRAVTRSIRGLKAVTRLWHAEGVFTVVTPSLCCDETKTEAHALAWRGLNITN